MIVDDTQLFFEELREVIQVNLPKIRQMKEIYSVKADGSYLSEADIYIQSIILQKVSSFFPNCIVVSEESHDPGIDGSVDGIIVFIDPLDGTENFLSGLPNWAIGISVYSNGSHIGSMVYQPDFDDYEDHTTIRHKRRKQSRIVGLSSGEDRKFIDTYPNTKELRLMGCSQANLLYVARGCFKTYSNASGANCWDILPGLNIARAAMTQIIFVEGEKYLGQLLPPSHKYSVHLSN